MKNFLVALSLTIIVVALVIAAYFEYDKAKCSAKTYDLGYRVRWTELGGCQLEVLEGQWIPLENLLLMVDLT